MLLDQSLILLKTSIMYGISMLIITLIVLICCKLLKIHFINLNLETISPLLNYYAFIKSKFQQNKILGLDHIANEFKIESIEKEF